MSKQGFVTLRIVVFENVIFGISQMLSFPLCSNASILSRCGKGIYKGAINSNSQSIEFF